MSEETPNYSIPSAKDARALAKSIGYNTSAAPTEPAATEGESLSQQRLAEIAEWNRLPIFAIEDNPHYARIALDDLLADNARLRERNAMLGGALDDSRRDVTTLNAAAANREQQIREALARLLEYQGKPDPNGDELEVYATLQSKLILAAATSLGIDLNQPQA